MPEILALPCPTITFRNKYTGKCITINSSDYHNARVQHITAIGPLSNWELSTESSQGGQEGFDKSDLHGQIQANLVTKRKTDILRPND